MNGDINDSILYINPIDNSSCMNHVFKQNNFVDIKHV